MFGVKMKVGHADPEIDVERVAPKSGSVWAKKPWLAVDANQQWNFDRALRAGRAFEKLGVAWLEEPLICDDVVGHARLVDKLDIPIALGETLASRFEFAAYIRAGAVDTLQPDIIRAGGITECAKIVPSRRYQWPGPSLSITSWRSRSIWSAVCCRKGRSNICPGSLPPSKRGQRSGTVACWRRPSRGMDW